MFNRQFYHASTRKMTIIFGSLFNNINIERYAADGTTIQSLKVPVSYGPRQKYLAIIEQYLASPNPDGAEKQPIGMLLPRIAFEIKDMTYAPERRLPKIRTVTQANENAAARNYQYTPVPYDIRFSLSIMTKNFEDGPKIYEQILPYFGPEFTVTANMIPEMGILRDIPIILNGMQAVDEYQGNYIDRRLLTWELDFTMKADFFGPVYTAKPIKNINVNIYTPVSVDKIGDALPVINLNLRPGLTVDGEPTTEASNSVPLAQIQKEDNWGFIETITEYFGAE